MANIWDKYIDLERQIQSLKTRLGAAERSGAFPDFELAIREVLVTERRLKAVRAMARAHWRKARERFQAVCEHKNRVAVKTRYTEAQVTVTEVEACTACSKTFDLRERIS